MAETKPDKKQITLSFKTKDPREIEMYEYFVQAMSRQALIKGILWDYYQKAKANGYMPPAPVTQETHTPETNQHVAVTTETTSVRKKNKPGMGAIALAG